MQFDTVTFWHAASFAFLGELGDKTFLLAIIFSAWCPWEGARSGEGAACQQVLVFLGTFTALAVHQILIVVAPEKIAPASHLAGFFNGAACLLCLLLAVRVHRHMRALAKQNKKEAQGEDEPLKTTFETWNPTAFFNNSPVSREYGAVSQSDAFGILGDRMPDRYVSDVLAFLVPLVMVFLAEAEDKSQGVTLEGSPQHGANFGGGCILGLMPVVMIAVFTGFVTERQCADHQVLNLVFSLLLLVGLIAFSQAVLHVSALQSPAMMPGGYAVRGRIDVPQLAPHPPAPHPPVPHATPDKKTASLLGIVARSFAGEVP